ncbi:7816_t:CDS:2, partial [Scutellospora calospora]
GLEKHRFTKDIIVLGVKATNKYNRSSICRACDKALSWEDTLNIQITNKKNITNNKAEHASQGQASKKCQNSSIYDPAIREFFEFLNPNLVLLSQDTLFNHILNSENINLNMSHKQKLKEDSIEVTLAFNG